MPTYTSQYPSAHSSTYVKATTENVGFEPYKSTDPALSLTGGITGTTWLSDAMTNQRFHIDLGSAKTIRRIYYENWHNSGASTNVGSQNFTFWGSNTGAGSFDDLVYGNDEGWTQITTATSVFIEHIAVDQADPYYITANNVIAYRYYAFKFADNHGHGTQMGFRHTALQTEDGWTPTVTVNAIMLGANF